MKGQAAIEFLSMVSLSALLLAALYGLTASKQLEVSRFQQVQEEDAVAEEMGFQVEMALVQGEGYSRRFSVPVKISGNFYNISAGHSRIILETDDSIDRRPSLYDGDWVNISTRESNTYRIYNTGELDVQPAE